MQPTYTPSYSLFLGLFRIFFLLSLSFSPIFFLGCEGCQISPPRQAPQEEVDPNIPAARAISLGKLQIGAATAGFQVDMGCPNDKKECLDTQSDWYQWVTDPLIKLNPLLFTSRDPITQSPGFWELYPQDLKQLRKELFGQTFRMSIEWSRIFPTSTEKAKSFEDLKKIANHTAIRHYHRMFRKIRSLGLRPFVTLNHYTLPLWIHNGVLCRRSFITCKDRGWTDPSRIIPEIVKYTEFVAQEFGKEIDDWITLNEPYAIVLPGYIMPGPSRVNPPALRFHLLQAKHVLLAMIEAHARMVDALRKYDRYDADGDGKATYIGLAYNILPIAPNNPASREDRQAAKNASYLINDVFLDAIALGHFDPELNGKIVNRPDLKRLDFLGINYYGRLKVSALRSSLPKLFSPLFTFNPLSFKQEELYPKGLYQTIKRAYRRYKLPIVITENGAAIRKPEDEKEMDSYLIRHLFWLHVAQKKGYPIDAYLYWSLIDNYEWNHGFKWRFGLYALDRTDPQKKRYPRDIAKLFALIARTKQLPQKLLTRYLTNQEKQRLEQLP
ncbi:MAG: glycoside hydrolase family 1 protein [Myxococcales bacterium]|nr:glycoside hydrolase family 1 protein [Myxococcales bacterium]